MEKNGDSVSPSNGKSSIFSQLVLFKVSEGQFGFEILNSFFFWAKMKKNNEIPL